MRAMEQQASSAQKRPHAHVTDGAPALRIIHITDVYTLENFPSLRTLIKDKREEWTAAHGEHAQTISVLTGPCMLAVMLPMRSPTAFAVV